MAKASIEYLFSERRATKPTREWVQLLRDGKDAYANCRVVSFSRVKNLNSKWKHEYVQFIVEEETTKDRARVYAERGNEVDLDWVTFGPAETPASGGKGSDDLPLPLASMVFGGDSGDDASKRPTVLEVAEILAATTSVGGAYELYGHSCFWYAYTSYDAVKRWFGKLGKEKVWRWVDVGGAGNAGVKDAMGLGWTTLFKFYYVSDANKFKKERETNMDFYDNEQRTIVDSQYFVNQIASDLSKPDTRIAYIDTMRAQGVEFTDAQIQQLLQASEQKAKEEAGKEAFEENWTKDFDILNTKFVRRVFADPESAVYSSAYQSYRIPEEMEEDVLDHVPRAATKDAVATKTAEALRVVVGRILLDATGKVPKVDPSEMTRFCAMQKEFAGQ